MTSTLRIIAGESRGRRIKVPPGGHTRPTLDRVREAIFSMVGDLHEARVLDLFAGSGAMGLEALSRGAAHAVFVESAAKAASVLGQNVDALDYTHRARVLRMSASRALGDLRSEEARFDAVFLDPPYHDTLQIEESLDGLIEGGLVCLDGVVVVEHGAQQEVPKAKGALMKHTTRRYGHVAVSIYFVHPNSEQDDQWKEK